MSELAAILTAMAALLTPIGVAIAFVWGKVERRIAEIERKTESCEARETIADQTIRKLTFEVRRDGWAVRLLATELHKVDPMNVTLGNVAIVLRQQYQPDLGLPDDLTDLLAQLGRVPNLETTR